MGCLKKLSNIFKKCLWIVIRLDDIPVIRSEHLKNKDDVLQKLKFAGIRLKKKCMFMMKLLGHLKNKYENSQQKVIPFQRVKKRQRTCMLNYYGRYSPKLSTVLAPLYEILFKNIKCSWGSKHYLIRMYFDSTKKLVNTLNRIRSYNVKYHIRGNTTKVT